MVNCRLKLSNQGNGEVINIYGESKHQKYSVRWENGEFLNYFSRTLQLVDDNITNYARKFTEKFDIPQENKCGHIGDDLRLISSKNDQK